MYIVNWYPGSYGDRIIADLFNVPYYVSSNDTYCLPLNSMFKFPETYKLGIDDLTGKIRENISPDLETYNVIGAHRLNKFDFKTVFPNCKVISIDPGTNLQLISDAYFKKVYGIRSMSDNPVVKMLIKNDKIEYAKKYQIKLILQWKQNNILDTDIIFSLDEYIKDKNYLNWFKVNAMQ